MDQSPAALVFQTETSPTNTGRIILPPETRPADARRYVAGLRDHSTNRKTLPKRAFAHGFSCIGYCVGMIFTARPIGEGEPKQTVNIRSPDDANVCLPVDQMLSYPGARIGLSILVAFYGIAIAAAYEQMMQLHRWSVVHWNPVNFLWLENVFQRHFLLSYWCFHHLLILGGRAFTTGLHGTVVTRLCVGFITPLALLIGWDSATQFITYRNAVFAMTWVTFGGMVLSSVVVLASTRKDYVPDDDPIVTAVVIQDLVELLRETNGTMRTEKMKIGSVQVHGVETTPTQYSFSRVSARTKCRYSLASWLTTSTSAL